ncbi:hypothetical protein ES708_02358 [subsurface metagenome]
MDLYTKIVLTVIAACLLWISVRNITFTTDVNALPTDRGDDVLKVQIVSIDESPNLRW